MHTIWSVQPIIYISTSKGVCTVDIGSTGRPDSITKFEFSRPVYMIYFTEDHQYLEPRRGYLKSYFVEEFMQNEAGKFKFCDPIWPAS